MTENRCLQHCQMTGSVLIVSSCAIALNTDMACSLLSAVTPRYIPPLLDAINVHNDQRSIDFFLTERVFFLEPHVLIFKTHFSITLQRRNLTLQ